jgi:hypothetical protein
MRFNREAEAISRATVLNSTYLLMAGAGHRGLFQEIQEEYMCVDTVLFVTKSSTFHHSCNLGTNSDSSIGLTKIQTYT